MAEDMQTLADRANKALKVEGLIRVAVESEAKRLLVYVFDNHLSAHRFWGACDTARIEHDRQTEVIVHQP